MTDSNRSHITLIVDRSGSMSAVRDDAEDGVRTFIRGQQSVDKPATFLFVQFDDKAPFEVLYRGSLAGYSGEYMLFPRGMTPLLDAIGRGIVRTGEVLSAIPEDQRPEHVFFVVQTDGGENHSREFTFDAVNKMIKEQEETYSWDFIWLGTGIEAQEAFAHVSAGTRSMDNTVSHAPTGASVETSYLVTSASIGATRSGKSVENYGATVDDDGNVVG